MAQLIKLLQFSQHLLGSGELSAMSKSAASSPASARVIDTVCRTRRRASSASRLVVVTIHALSRCGSAMRGRCATRRAKTV
jgi:hypothetical protein